MNGEGQEDNTFPPAASRQVAIYGRKRVALIADESRLFFGCRTRRSRVLPRPLEALINR